jgi:hypothetical protein
MHVYMQPDIFLMDELYRLPLEALQNVSVDTTHDAVVVYTH